VYIAIFIWGCNIIVYHYFSELEDAKSRALDNLGRVYARKGSYQKAIDV
jgi:hypothetical protein